MEENIIVLTEAAGKYGLILNEKNTKVLYVRGSEKIEKVGGYSVEKEVKYLGVWVGGIPPRIRRIYHTRITKRQNKVIYDVIKNNGDHVLFCG